MILYRGKPNVLFARLSPTGSHWLHWIYYSVHMISNTTNCVTFGHLNVIWYDIQQDICCFCFFCVFNRTNYVTSDMTSYMICDITSGMTSHMKLHLTWHLIWHSTGHLFFCWVFNDIKSNTPSDRLSVLTSNRTNYMIFDMTSYVICDIISDIQDDIWNYTWYGI